MLPTTIDDLKSTIGRRGGVARSNRFAIYISHPNKKQGLLNTDWTGLASNLLTTITNSGSIDPMMFFNDPRDMFLLCSSVQLPGKRIATMEKRTTHKAVKKPYSYLVEEVSFTFTLTNDYYIKKYFDSWQDMIVSGGDKGIAYKSTYTTDIVIQQMGSGNDFIPAYGVKLLNAFPIAVNAIELSNRSENQVVEVSITLGYDDWTEESLFDSIGSLWNQGKSLMEGTMGQIGAIRNLF
jgi:hypothetical protein